VILPVECESNFTSWGKGRLVSRKQGGGRGPLGGTEFNKRGGSGRGETHVIGTASSARRGFIPRSRGRLLSVGKKKE